MKHGLRGNRLRQPYGFACQALRGLRVTLGEVKPGKDDPGLGFERTEIRLPRLVLGTSKDFLGFGDPAQLEIQAARLDVRPNRKLDSAGLTGSSTRSPVELDRVLSASPEVRKLRPSEEDL